MKRSKAYGAAFVIASLINIGGSIFFAEEVWESRASAEWPHVPGIIVTNYTEKTCGSRSSSSWEAKLLYEYRVEGHNYRSDRVTNMRIYCDRDREAAIAWLKSHFPSGGPTEVYYNPSDPGAAFLHPGVVSTIDILMIFATLILGALMAVGAVLSFRPAVAGSTASRSLKLTFRIRR